MSINNREDANKYYKIVNELIDNYIETWKIRPSSLKRYLKPGSKKLKNFIERNHLNGIRGIERVIEDVVEDRYYMESDNIIKFENFSNNIDTNDIGDTIMSVEYQPIEKCLEIGIERANLDMEKEIADYFDTNLGHIKCVNTQKHEFMVGDWSNKEKHVVIYSGACIETIKNNIIEHLYDILSNKDIELIDGVAVNIQKIIDKDIFYKNIENVLDTQKILDIISKIICCDYCQETKSGYHIWQNNVNNRNV
jgi:hypothetical protein